MARTAFGGGGDVGDTNGMKSIMSMLGILLLSGSALAAPADYFAIRVVDDATGRGVPLITLQTTSKANYYTDSNGYVAFFEPGLMNTEVWFGISSPGYEFPGESFGFRGTPLKAVPGTEAVLKVRRVNLAERMYRLTGQGIYRDTLLLGKKSPVKEGALNRSVTGQDSAFATEYRGELFWLWGDTNRAQHPLGNFFVAAARVKLPGKGGLDPSVGVDFEYFWNEATNFTKEMCRISQESKPIWLDSLLVVKDESGRDRLMARFARTGADLIAVDQGLVIYNDEKEVFEHYKTFPLGENRIVMNHQLRAVVGGVEYFYGVSPYPWIRVPATFAGVGNPEAYEVFTCLTAGPGSAVDRGADGRAVWKWRKGVQPLDRKALLDLHKSGELSREETPFDLTDVETGKPVNLHGGSVYWNEYRKRWIMIGVEIDGASYLGEVWYAEANAPEGPWKAARKVATHAEKDRNMDLYNPVMHPYFNQQGGRIIYFEGTYTNSFSGTKHQTPYYEYNQLMYRLDLGDPRLKLPEPPPGLSDAKPSPNGPS